MMGRVSKLRAALGDGAREVAGPERRRRAAEALLIWYTQTFGARRARRYIGALAAELGVALPAPERHGFGALGGAWALGLLMGLVLGASLGMAGGGALNASGGKGEKWPPQLLAIQDLVRAQVTARGPGVDGARGGAPPREAGAERTGGEDRREMEPRLDDHRRRGDEGM
ncbi:MAG: hypothetical protein U0166_03040 [Acidobacteriota bacterium]